MVEEATLNVTGMKHLVKILITTFSTILVIFGSFALYWYQNRIHYLDYATYASPGLLTHIYHVTEKEDTVSLMINNKKLSNISQFDVFVGNLGDADLSDVDIYIDLYHDEKPVNVVVPNYHDANFAKEGIMPLATQESAYPNGKRYGYRIKALTRQSGFKESFSFRFLIEGDIEPKVKLHTLTAGVKVREWSDAHGHNGFFESHTVKHTVLLIAGFILGAIYTPTVFRLWLKIKRRKQKQPARRAEATSEVHD